MSIASELAADLLIGAEHLDDTAAAMAGDRDSLTTQLGELNAAFEGSGSELAATARAAVVAAVDQAEKAVVAAQGSTTELKSYLVALGFSGLNNSI